MTDQIIVDKLDEVHNIITTTNRGIAQEISDYFTFDVPGAKHMKLVQNGMWDGKIRLFNRNTRRLYKGLNHHLVDLAKTLEYDLTFNYDTSAENFSVAEAVEFVKTLDLPDGLVPRDYQIKALVDAVRHHHQTFLSPTASGKSLIIYMILRYYACATLIIVDSSSLLHQMASDFESYGFDSDKYVQKVVGTKDQTVNYPIVVTTWHTAHKMPQEWFDQFDLVMVDEAHRAKAKSLVTMMEMTKNCPYKFGFTGTIDKAQAHQLTIEGLLGPINQSVTTAGLIDKGYLADLSVKIIVLQHGKENAKLLANAQQKKQKTEKYRIEQSYLVSSTPRNNFIKNLALSLEGNTLILFQLVDLHGKPLYDLIKGSTDRPVFFIHGEVDGEVRNNIKSSVADLDDAIIIGSYGTMSTGVNIPNLTNAIAASPRKARIGTLQMIGRILRKAKGKDSATLFDIADDLSVGSKKNFTLHHMYERVSMYNEQNFKYKIYQVKLQ